MSTTAADALLILFAALPEDEQDEAFARIEDIRLRQEAGSESDTERFIRSVRRVAEYVGHPPSVDEYKQASQELIEAGEDIETFARVYARFGSWPRVREVLKLSETNTARKIEARFRYRKVGKVWRFTEDTLGDALARCVEHYGRPPMVSEFVWWREQELELARAAGHDGLHLPSPSPYRRRWKSWEAALLYFGYTPDQVAERLEQP